MGTFPETPQVVLKIRLNNRMMHGGMSFRLLGRESSHENPSKYRLVGRWSSWWSAPDSIVEEQPKDIGSQYGIDCCWFGKVGIRQTEPIQVRPFSPWNLSPGDQGTESGQHAKLLYKRREVYLCRP